MRPTATRPRAAALAFGVAAMSAVLGDPARSCADTSTPSVVMGIELLDTANNPLPQSAPHTYTLGTNQQFRVRTTASIVSPYMADEFHVDENFELLPPIDLGIQTIAFHLLSAGGTSGLVVPRGISTPPHPISVWALDDTRQAAKLFNPTNIGTFYNLIDLDGDGDLDPVGLGYSNQAVLQGGYGDAMSPTYLQSLQNGLGTQTGVLLGGYSTSSLTGMTTLTTEVTTFNALIDSPAQDNTLRAVNHSNTAVPATITIIVVPEPAALTVVAASLACLLRRTKRSQK